MDAMFRSFTPALMLSFAVHLAAVAGYWLWGSDTTGRDSHPVVEVALIMEVSAPAEPTPAVAPPSEPVEPESEAPTPAEVEPEPRPEPVAMTEAPAPRVAKAPPPPTRPAPRAVPPPRPVEAPVAPAAESVTRIDPGLIASIEQAYKSALQAEIARHRSYPHIARRLRQEGTVEIGFVVLADGRLTGIALTDSSGHELLDRAALQAVEDVGRFRPIPAELARERWALSVPLNFRLL